MGDLLEALRRGPVLCDGAMGTMLDSTPGVRLVDSVEFLVRKPERVLEIHKAYAAAGARIMTTNTFGANRIKLTRSGLEARVADLNQIGVKLARQAADTSAWVAGDLGPTGELLAPLGDLSFERARDAYAEQAAILAAAGADAIIIETMSDLAEARAAIDGARRATKLPVICTVTFEDSLRTMMGTTPEEAVATLLDCGADVVGTNCGVGPDLALRVIEKMHSARPYAMLAAQPNAGMPRLVKDQAVYDVGPEEFASYTPRFVQAGVRLVGGCCGTTPDTIKAMAAELARLARTP